MRSRLSVFQKRKKPPAPPVNGTTGAKKSITHTSSVRSTCYSSVYVYTLEKFDRKWREMMKMS